MGERGGLRLDKCVGQGESPMRPEATSLLIKPQVIEEDTLICFLPARKMASETNEAAMSSPSLLQGEIPTIPGPWSRRQTLAWLSQGPEQGLQGGTPSTAPSTSPAHALQAGRAAGSGHWELCSWPSCPIRPRKRAIGSWQIE